ncbi:MAG: Omp28-related outer membrane protein [Saprospiraceae bacterium]
MGGFDCFSDWRRCQCFFGVEKSFDVNTRNLSLDVDILPLDDLPSDCIRLSLLLTETGIVDYQLLPSPVGWKADYNHKHVLRDIISNFDGDVISEPLTPEIRLPKIYLSS